MPQGSNHTDDNYGAHLHLHKYTRVHLHRIGGHNKPLSMQRTHGAQAVGRLNADGIKSRNRLIARLITRKTSVTRKAIAYGVASKSDTTLTNRY